MPHGMCYLWRSDVLWLHVISDALIALALAHASISITLLYFVRKRRDVPTAFLLIRLMPAALAIPSLVVSRRAYGELQSEVEQRSRVEQDLIVANRRLSKESARGKLASIVESSEHAILSMDNDGPVISPENARIFDLAQVLVREPGGRIVRWNHGAEQLYGYCLQRRRRATRARVS